jgi:hypothetical protein
MPTRQRSTLKASERGKTLIRDARKKKIEPARNERNLAFGKAWNIDDIFLKEASKILEPSRTWDNVPEGCYAVSFATCKRFREAKQSINAVTFKAFCQVLDLNWEDVAENEVDANRNLGEAPPVSSFYGRTQELAELRQWLIQEQRSAPKQFLIA